MLEAKNSKTVNDLKKFKNIEIASDEYIDVGNYSSKQHKKSNKVISLFSGAGGLDLGLEAAGFDTVACVELDKDCRETLFKNRPKWGVIEKDNGDIRKITSDYILNTARLKKGEAALVVGGAPCQPFSNIGKKLGKDDPTNGDLFLEFVRIIRGVSPKAFIFENVVGITQNKHREVIHYMVEKFQGLGYSISHKVLNAADYGVPQKRERFFIVGIKGNQSFKFPKPTHYKALPDNEIKLDFIESAVPWKTVKDAFQEIPKNHNKRPDYVLMNLSEIVVERMQYIGPNQNFKAVPKHLLPDCWKNGKHQGADTFGRLAFNEPSVTIRTAAYNPSKGKYIHPKEHRGLSSIEMAALQTFPYEWKFHCAEDKKVTLVSVGKQIGNAVPVKLAEALGKAVMLQLKDSSR